MTLWLKLTFGCLYVWVVKGANLGYPLAYERSNRDESKSLQCECTTKDCKVQRMVTCNAKFACYVQMHATGDGMLLGPVVRGCIDLKTPILCENRRPQQISIKTSWPVLHCCKKDFCNKQVMPTLPVDIKASTSPKPKRTGGNRNNCNEEPGGTRCKQNSDLGHSAGIPFSTVYPVSYLQDHSLGNKQQGVNPMYVAVPVAGVCILLALILFALYLLRQRSDYNSFHSPVSSLGGATNPMTTKDITVVSGVKASTTTTVSSTSVSFGDQMNPSSDSERSSSGSETKLFLQV